MKYSFLHMFILKFSFLSTNEVSILLNVCLVILHIKEWTQPPEQIEIRMRLWSVGMTHFHV